MSANPSSLAQANASRSWKDWLFWPFRPIRRLVLLLLLVVGLGIGGFYGWRYWKLEHQLGQAQTAANRYRYLEAKTLLEPCLATRPNHPETLLLAMRVGRGLGLYEGVEDLLQRYEKEHGVTDAFVLERVLLKADRGELDAVRDYCMAKINQQDPQTPLIVEALIRGAIRRFRLADAELLLSRWMENDPENIQRMFLQARVEELKDRLPMSITLYEEILQRDPDMDEARLRLVRILMKTNRNVEALQHLEYLMPRLQAEEIQTRYAICLEQTGQVTKARDLLDEVLRTDPTNVLAMEERARIGKVLDEPWSTIEKLLRKACELDPSSISTLDQLVECLDQQGKKEEATALRSRAKQLAKDFDRMQAIIRGEMQLRPNDPAIHFELGVIALRSGIFTEGVRWLKSTLELNPNHRGAHEALAIFYQSTQNPAMASFHRDQARKLAGPAKNKETTR